MERYDEECMMFLLKGREKVVACQRNPIHGLVQNPYNLANTCHSPGFLFLICTKTLLLFCIYQIFSILGVHFL